MSVLSDRDIRAALKAGDVAIRPYAGKYRFFTSQLYDLHPQIGSVV